MNIQELKKLLFWFRIFKIRFQTLNSGSKSGAGNQFASPQTGLSSEVLPADVAEPRVINPPRTSLELPMTDEKTNRHKVLSG